MDRNEIYLATITYLLAALVYETGNGNTPGFIAVLVLLILYGLPIYVILSFMYGLVDNSSSGHYPRRDE